MAPPSRSRFLTCACFILLSASGMYAAPASKPLMKDFMGLNGHTVQFKPELYSAVGRLVRDFHPVEWDLQGDTSKLPAWPEARNRVNWEQVYGAWKKCGYTIDASLMFETVPRDQWKDIQRDSFAYGASFAREFGPSGSRHLVESVEIGNEPGKWSDEDYRVMFENMARGLRQGDPRLRIATCAITAEKSGEYAKSISCLKGLENLYDVINVHSYAQLENWPTWRRSFPEDPQLKNYLQDVESVCRKRDEIAPSKPVWITEFGYDSTTQPATGDSKQWVGVTDEQQAQWIVRSYLIFSSMPVERAYLYFFNDEDKPGLHACSGLTRHFQPKPSFYAVSHLYHVLGDFRFSRLVTDAQSPVRVQEYTHESDPGKRVWVLWSPTGEGRKTSYRINNPPGRLVRIEAMQTQSERIASAGTGVAFILRGNSMDVPVDESPIYITWEVKR